MPILASRGAASAAGFGFGRQPPVAGTYATWNPSDKYSTITLSNGNLTAAFPSVGTGTCVRATIGKASGIWYWEGIGIAINAITGIAAASLSTSNTPGATTTSWGYAPNGNIYNNNSIIATYASYTSTDTIGIVLNMTALTVSFYKNGTLQGSLSITSGTYFPCTGNVGFYNPYSMTANFGASAFTETVPGGANPGVY